MKKILELISEEMQQAFEAAGYDPALGKVTIYVNISAMVPWRVLRSIRKHRL